MERKGPTPTPLRIALIVLAVADAVLFAVAWARGATEVRDGAGSVTTGTNVALSILATGAAALAWNAVRVPVVLKRTTQVFALASIALHALGHLADIYYTWRSFDDVLHAILTAFAAFLALRHAQALRLFPASHSTPLRSGLLTVTIALAFAGAWEIFEFTMDEIMGTREQDDLRDTMLDMIDGLAGGVTAGAVAYRRPKPS